MKPSLFSVVVPYHNRETFLPRTLYSLKTLRYRPVELLLVDNGSVDGSAEVCRSFCKANDSADFSIRLLEERHPGAAAARNAGLFAAQGEMVFFFDSDDEASPEFLTDMAELLQNADMAVAPTTMYFPDGTTQVRATCSPLTPATQILVGMLATQGMAFRTDFLREIGGWDAHLRQWDDWELGIRALMSQPRAAITTKPYHRIHQHGESLTGTSFASTLDGILQALHTARTDIDNWAKHALRESKNAKTTAHQRNAMLNALYARTAFVAGRLRREGYPEKAKQLYKEVKNAAISNYSRYSCFLIYAYVARGGKGWWWIAHHVMRLA